MVIFHSYVNVYQASYTTMYTIHERSHSSSARNLGDAPRQAEEDPPPQQQGHLERVLMARISETTLVGGLEHVLFSPRVGMIQSDELHHFSEG